MENPPVFGWNFPGKILGNFSITYWKVFGYGESGSWKCQPPKKWWFLSHTWMSQEVRIKG